MMKRRFGGRAGAAANKRDTSIKNTIPAARRFVRKLDGRFMARSVWFEILDRSQASAARPVGETLMEAVGTTVSLPSSIAAFWLKPFSTDRAAARRAICCRRRRRGIFRVWGPISFFFHGNKQD